MPSNTDWEAQVRAREDSARLAFLHADLPSLEALWAPEFVVNSPLGKVLDRNTVLELLRTGRIRHLGYESIIEHLSRLGDLVIVMGNDTVQEPPDRRVVRRRFTNIWQFRDGQWLTVARHASPLPSTG